MHADFLWHGCDVECIQVDEGADDGETFLDIVDNFDGMSDEDDEDVSFVSMGGIRCGPHDRDDGHDACLLGCSAVAELG